MDGDSSDMFPSKVVSSIVTALSITLIKPLPKFFENSQSIMKFSIREFDHKTIVDDIKALFSINFVRVMLNRAESLASSTPACEVESSSSPTEFRRNSLSSISRTVLTSEILIAPAFYAAWLSVTLVPERWAWLPRRIVKNGAYKMVGGELLLMIYDS